jgi:hypothetical protein
MGRSLYNFELTPTKPVGETIESVAGAPRIFQCERNFGVHFSMKKPSPDATAEEVKKATLNAHSQRIATLKKEQHGFDSINAFKRATTALNQLDRGSSIKPSKKQQRNEAAARELRLTMFAAKAAQCKSMVKKDQIKRERDAASRMAIVVRHQDEHFMSTMELSAAEEIARGRAEDKAREASDAMSAVQAMGALGEEMSEEESEGEEEESDEGSQGEEQEDTPPVLVPATSYGILVTVGSAVPVPQQVPAATAATSAELLVAQVDPFPPAAPTSRPVDVSPAISAVVLAGSLSPELEAPLSPAASRLVRARA